MSTIVVRSVNALNALNVNAGLGKIQQYTKIVVPGIDSLIHKHNQELKEKKCGNTFIDVLRL